MQQLDHDARRHEPAAHAHPREAAASPCSTSTRRPRAHGARPCCAGPTRNPRADRMADDRRATMIDVVFPLAGQRAAARPPAGAGRRAGARAALAGRPCRGSACIRVNAGARQRQQRPAVAARASGAARASRSAQARAGAAGRARHSTSAAMRCDWAMPHAARAAAARHAVRAPGDRQRVTTSSTSWPPSIANSGRMGVRGRAICGRRQVVAHDGRAADRLQPDAAWPVAARLAARAGGAGLGRHRRLGCGVFVPHKSAAAVGRLT